jgi:hypothetical protein
MTKLKKLSPVFFPLPSKKQTAFFENVDGQLLASKNRTVKYERLPVDGANVRRKDYEIIM